MVKKTIFAMALLGAVVTADTMNVQANNNPVVIKNMKQEYNWRKSVDGTWTGKYNGEEYIYKMKNGRLQQQYNNGEWSDVKDNIWYDSNGQRYRYNNKTVNSSIDGTNWMSVNGSIWQGNNGYWYKIDKDGTVWWHNSSIK